MTSSVFNSIAQIAARFGRADDGNIAATFALALLPLLAFVGAAVDYSHANVIRAHLELIADAATDLGEAPPRRGWSPDIRHCRRSHQPFRQISGHSQHSTPLRPLT